MTYTDIIIQRIQKKRKILVEATDPFMIPLSKNLEHASHKVVIQFIFSAIKPIIQELKSIFPDLKLIENAFKDAQRWAYGEVKMGVVKPQILAIHRLSKTNNKPEQVALLHAYAQGLSVIHSKKHAMGLPIYELTAIILKHEVNRYEEVIQTKLAFYEVLLQRIHSTIDINTYADFIQNKGE